MSAPARPYCGRFAPSPSGPLHFGSLLAALAGFLQARSQNGDWLVRIEDVDPPRVVAGAATAILHALEHFGLHWDGPVSYQSQRTECYLQALQDLQAQGVVYPCTCSRREIAQQAALAADGSRIYPGFCRSGPGHPERPAARRLRCQNLDSIEFYDRIQGQQSQNLAAEVGDFVLQRADGVFAYQLAVVVDDAEQGITEVVRGCDLLSSTARQIYLQRLLGLVQPAYCHLPLILDERGDKLSKQTGALALDTAQAPALLVTALELLGQQPQADLATEPVETILGWAIAHWRIDKVPAVLASVGNKTSCLLPTLTRESH